MGAFPIVFRNQVRSNISKGRSVTNPKCRTTCGCQWHRTKPSPDERIPTLSAGHLGGLGACVLVKACQHMSYTSESCAVAYVGSFVARPIHKERIHILKIPRSRNVGPFLPPGEIHPSKSRICLGRTPELPDSCRGLGPKHTSSKPKSRALLKARDFPEGGAFDKLEAEGSGSILSDQRDGEPSSGWGADSDYCLFFYGIDPIGNEEMP